jgi:cysteinyl-tRNA synthetase
VLRKILKSLKGVTCMNKNYLKMFLLILSVFVIYDNSVFAVSKTTVSDFAYVINGAEINDILNTTFDLVIIDYSKDGSEEGKYTASQIQLLKNNNTIPIAYFSIGEAEDYRYY